MFVSWKDFRVELSIYGYNLLSVGSDTCSVNQCEAGVNHTDLIRTKPRPRCHGWRDGWRAGCTCQEL